jgi:hypothetical protein
MDLKALGSSACCVPNHALPFVLHHGIAEPAITLEPRGAERLQAALLAGWHGQSGAVRLRKHHTSVVARRVGGGGKGSRNGADAAKALQL